MITFEEFSFPKSKIKPMTIRLVFFFLYFTVTINQLIESFYMKALLQEDQSQLDSISIILDILKSVTPIFVGFIIDHIQYQTNLLLMSLVLSLLSQIFFLFYCITTHLQPQLQYLFFAITYIIIAEQSQMLLILTFIPKAWERSQIPKQVSMLLQSYNLGKVLSDLLLLPLDWPSKTKMIKNQLFFIYMFVLFIILSIEIYQAYLIFPHLKYHSQERNSYLKVYNPDTQTSLLVSLKKILKSTMSLFSITAGLIICICKSWFDLQFQFLSIFFSEYVFDSNQYNDLHNLICYTIAIMILQYFKHYFTEPFRKLRLLSMCGSTTIFCFLLMIQIGYLDYSQLSLKLFLYFIVSIILQFGQCGGYMSVYTILGQNQEIMRIQGFSFGMFSFFLNFFQLCLISVLFSEKQHNSLRGAFQLEIYISFSLAYGLIGFVFSRLLTYIYFQRQKLPIRKVKDIARQSNGEFVEIRREEEKQNLLKD